MNTETGKADGGRSSQASGYAAADAVDLAQWHDVIVSVMESRGTFDKNELTPDRLFEIYQLLPEKVKVIADEWSMSDTVFRDEAGLWLESNWTQRHNDKMSGRAAQKGEHE